MFRGTQFMSESSKISYYYPPMRAIHTAFALLAFQCLAGGLALSQTKPPAADAYKNEALVFERLETTYRMHADGTGERDMHIVVRIQSNGAAQQFGVLSFSYASANETPNIRMVRVHKTDGTTVDTPPSDAIDMPAEVTREAPLYSDMKEKHLPVRSLAAGDTLEYEVDTTINKAETPGQFWGSYHFTPPGSFVVLSETLTLEIPADKYVQVWCPHHPPSMKEEGGTRIYTWKEAQLVTAPKPKADGTAKPPAPKDPDEDSDGRKLPSVAWTTFHSWAEVGDWYRNLSLAQSAPTDALRARAADMTKDAKTPEEQVQALYNFVSTQTRYVGIDFGIGRYKPHTADEVLAYQYGDCKDKDTLLEALLRAKGFSTAPALVGVGIAPAPEVPSPAMFNHVITTVKLPDRTIWLDSTVPAAPYRYLGATICDQQALVVPADGQAALEQTPASAPYPFSEHFEATGTLDAEGKLTAQIVSSYHDDNEVIVRAMARSVAPADWDKVSQYISANTGFGGTTSNTRFKNADNSADAIELTYNYERHPFGDWDNLRIVPLFPALEFSALGSNDSTPDDDIQLGSPRTLVAISHIRLPDGYRADLPDPIHVKTTFATFDKTYRFDGKEVETERRIVVLQKKVPKSDWKKYQAFAKDISLDGERWIQLIQPTKAQVIQIVPPASPPSAVKAGKGSVTVQVLSQEAANSKPDTANANPPAGAPVDDLMDQAREKMRSQDWSGARQILDEVKAKNPNEKNLWMTYGFIALALDRDYQTARADFQKELAMQPDNSLVATMLADTENRSGDSAAAHRTIQQYLGRHPGDLYMSRLLASLQQKANDYTGELKTLEAAVDQNPDDQQIRLQVSDTLIHLNRKEEAAAAAKTVLDGTQDPGLLNDAAYMLSQTGLDLDVAEQASRSSIAKLEEMSSTITSAEANSHTFAQANLLVASWDTLGWIDFREGKLDEAEPLVSATWRAAQQAEAGDHLAQIYEAQGKKNEALTTYILAQAAANAGTQRDVSTHITESIQRLKAAGAKSGPADPALALQALRTYKVARPSGVGGWGAFRLEITTAGVIESQQMSGEKRLAGIKPVIDAMKFPELMPPGSKAHLLRSAVVSCSMSKQCDVVLVPDGGLQTEAP